MAPSSPALHLDSATLRRIGVASSTDPRTVKRVSRGEYVRGDAARRAREALAAAGYAVPAAKPRKEKR